MNEPAAALIVTAAGLAAGFINTVVGSGSLITFPILVAIGYAPVVAYVSNTLGLIPGAVSGADGYRRELAGQRNRVTGLAPWAVAGGAAGAALLLVLPPGVFRAAVPVLVTGAAVLVAVQPWLSARLSETDHGDTGDAFRVRPLIFLAAVYGGYFGAAQSVITFALLSSFLNDTPQRLNALKVVIAVTVNAVAGVLFVGLAPISWPAAGEIALGSFAGGLLGASVGRRMSATALRAAMIVVAVVAIGRFVVG